jgi:hypothetical protein
MLWETHGQHGASSVERRARARFFGMRVAFLGNSYTYFNELPTVLATLAALTPAGVKLHHASVTPGGSSLADHATRSKASGAATAALLAEAPGWDYVVLQDQSQTPGGGMDGDSGAGVGVAKAKSIAALKAFYAPAIAAARATPVLYSTWGRHGGDPYNAACCGYGTFEGMTEQTSAGYVAYAAALKEAAPASAPLIVPAGRAFELVHEACAEPLANDSLFTSLYQQRALDADNNDDCVIHEADSGHPSPLGTYLIACTFVAAMLRQSLPQHGQRHAFPCRCLLAGPSGTHGLGCWAAPRVLQARLAQPAHKPLRPRVVKSGNSRGAPSARAKSPHSLPSTIRSRGHCLGAGGRERRAARPDAKVRAEGRSGGVTTILRLRSLCAVLYVIYS